MVIAARGLEQANSRADAARSRCPDKAAKQKSRLIGRLFKTGAGNETRTRDPDLGKVVLYQLSYSRNTVSVRARILLMPSPPVNTENHLSRSIAQESRKSGHAAFR
jgi:hypothetical protein